MTGENLKVRALLSIKRDRVGQSSSSLEFLMRSFVRFIGIVMIAWRTLEMMVRSSVSSRKVVGQYPHHREATRVANALEAESQSQNGSDGDNGNGGNGNGENGNGGNGNGNHGDGGNNGNGNPNENGRGAIPVARVCTYQDIVKCQPLNFKRTEGVVGLTRWFEKMKTVFHIGNCPKVYQVKMVPREEDQIKRYVGGLPDNIQGNVMSAEPTRLHDAIRLANSLMDQKLKGYAIKSA
ncbi:hypothetical protein Tco_0236849 [Tanacetum coccineum]